MLIDDLLERGSDIELTEHGAHRRAEIIAGEARHVSRRDGKKELLSS